MELDTGLVGYWKLAEDCIDYSGTGNHGISHNIDFTAAGPQGTPRGAARFNGRNSYIEVPDNPSLHFGGGPFSLSAWVYTEEALDDVPGDILSKYDPARRKGFHLSIYNNAGSPGGQGNYRQLQFGVDNSLNGMAWTDCGRPGNGILVFALAVCEGQLFAGTCEPGVGQHGNVYRYLGGTDWEECGIPITCNAVTTLTTYQGKLYAGTGYYDPEGSALSKSPNQTPGGHVFRYEGGKEWVDCGKPGGPEATGTGELVVFQGQLYAGSRRYEGGTTWVDCGNRSGHMAVFNGTLYATAGRGGSLNLNLPVTPVFRYAGGTTWLPCGHLEELQIYSIAIYQGEMYIGTWPNGSVYRWDGAAGWVHCGRLGNEQEVMGMQVYNGKLYAGTLPLAEVYRYEGGATWTRTGQLDTTPDVYYRRAWCMATYQGKLYCGTLPSGHVYALEAGKVVTYDHEFPAGWHHVVAVKDDSRRTDNVLRLYVDGKLVATSSRYFRGELYVTNLQPLLIGFGANEYFCGSLAEVRLYNRALADTDVEALYKG
jgi:hypothetical protein